MGLGKDPHTQLASLTAGSTKDHDNPIDSIRYGFTKALVEALVNIT